MSGRKNTFRLYHFVRDHLLFRLPPETAHHFALKLLTVAFHLRPGVFSRKYFLPCEVMGLLFPNPLGLAAGFDKNADYIEPLSALGFGFVEVGTVTPRAQSGNPAPRLFRLPQADALINRLGFNNKGVAHAVRQIKKIHLNKRKKIIIGVNIGKNKITPAAKAVEDYVCCFQQAALVADYVTVNLSSPNTAGLRDLQHGQMLKGLLSALKSAQQSVCQYNGRKVPLVIKIAPDLAPSELKSMADIFVEYAVDGVIATNTTIDRVGVENLPAACEAGGLSGRPLFAKSTVILQQLHALLAPHKIPLFGCGGIFSREDLLQKKAAGAVLFQIYSGLIYQGSGLIRQLL